MILSEGECRCVFMLAVTLENVMWAHAGACCHSLVISMKGRRGGHWGENSRWGKRGGKRKGGQCRKKRKPLKLQRKQETEIGKSIKKLYFTAVFFNPFISIKNDLPTLIYSMANHAGISALVAGENYLILIAAGIMNLGTANSNLKKKIDKRPL
jgi:hypothetical protein